MQKIEFDIDYSPNTSALYDAEFDLKEKVITSLDVSYLCLETMVNGRKLLMDGNQVAFHAEHYPQKASIKAEINDVDVYIYPTSTVASAMKQFRRKISKQNSQVAPNASRQRDF